jgi:hypothetical protein
LGSFFGFSRWDSVNGGAMPFHLRIEENRMRHFRVGDRVSWNSEAGRVTGVFKKKITRETLLKGRVHHASRVDPQYLIKSDRTDHIAIHKGQALRKLNRTSRKGARPAR